MPALDTIAAFQTTVGSTLAAGVFATGDSGTVRNGAASAPIKLLELFYDDVTSPQAARIRSPLLHDNVRGIQVFPGATAPAKLLPSYGLQDLEPQDTLTFELSTAAATGKAVLAAAIYYGQLPGAAARLYSPADVLPVIENVKPVAATIALGANTAGIWFDQVITTTENLLKANTDYAVLGITFDQPVAAVGVKGADTGNFRCCVPGGVNNPYAADYFVRKSMETGYPLIPVISSANAGSTFVSLISSAATAVAGTVQLILAQLNRNLS